MTLLEMFGQQGKAQQQAQQIGKNHPLMGEVAEQAWYAIAGLEPGEYQFVQRDRAESRERYLQCVVVEQRDTQQREGEQDEVERDAEHGGWVGCCDSQRRD